MRKLIAGNWKMFKTGPEADAMLRELGRQLGGACPADRDVLIFPPFTALEAAVHAMPRGGMVGGQDVYPAQEGAFTGEISPRMLQACGATWALTGHSERRHLLGESDELVGRKTAFALSCGLKVTLCIGETLEEREAGKLGEVLARQLKSGLGQITEQPNHLPNHLPDVLAVAYEPVWAIGTGRTAGASDIVEAHTLARHELKEILGSAGLKIRLLYGGSVKADNAGAILALDNVDGVLVGGASLQAESFIQIIAA